MRVLPNKAKTQRFCHQPPFRGNRTTTSKLVAYLRYDIGTSAAHAEAPLPAAAAPEPMGRVDRGVVAHPGPPQIRVGHARSSHTRQSSHGGKLTRPQPRVKS